MSCCGIDIGTYNLIVSRRGENGEVKSKKEVNCFLEVPLENRFTFNMLKASGVKLIERDKIGYAIGEKALDIAYGFPGMVVKRPMRDGCLNPEEKDAFRILMIMIHSLIGEVSKDKELVYYSVPANAINQETDADYHQKVLQDIFNKYKINDKTLQAFPINEGLALIFAELAEKNYTGIGISFGAGMINLCYAIFSQPIFQMSLVNSGDWIDKQAAKAAGEGVAVINKAKTKIDLREPAKDIVERAIKSQYHILVEKTMSAIKKALIDAGSKVRPESPIDIVIGGGTASPPGFEQLVAEVVKELNYPMPIGKIYKPDDHLYSVARGCLVAAENAQQ